MFDRKKFTKMMDEYPEQANGIFIDTCIKINSVDEIKEFVKLGINLHDKNILDSAFVNSCSCGNINIPLYLLEKGADINAKNGQAIVRACRYDQWDNLKMLLNRGIKMTQYNIVHISYQPTYEIALQIMLDHGIDPQLITNLLLEGLVKNSVHKDAIKWLILNGSNLNDTFRMTKSIAPDNTNQEILVSI